MAVGGEPKAWKACTRAKPASLTRAVQAAVWEVDPGVPVARVMPFDDILRDSVGDTRLLTLVLGVFAIVALVYAFLLALLAPLADALRAFLLKQFCPRTGKRHRLATMPLYRLRAALARLFLTHPASPIPLWLNSG